MGNIFSENILWSLGTIVVFFGIIAVYRLVSSRDKKNSFVVASDELINAFAPAIARLDAAILHVGSHDPPEISKFFRDNFEAHAAAIRKFGGNITPKRRRSAYEKAWKDYCDLEPNGGGITLFAGHYAPPGTKHLEFIKMKIENLLRFAK